MYLLQKLQFSACTRDSHCPGGATPACNDDHECIGMLTTWHIKFKIYKVYENAAGGSWMNTEQ